MRAALFLVALAVHPACAEEKIVSSDYGVATILTFKVRDEILQKFVPEGWQIVSPGSGMFSGSNLRFTFLDQAIALDSDGALVERNRSVVADISGRQRGTPTDAVITVGGMFATAGEVPPPEGIHVRANATVMRKTSTEPGRIVTQESWDFRTESDSIWFAIDYTEAVPEPSKTQAQVFLAGTPALYRVYRIEQAAHVVRAPGMDKGRNFNLWLTGNKLTPLLGSESAGDALVSLISIPWYSRRIYLPGAVQP
jgi:hypothetical protein